MTSDETAGSVTNESKNAIVARARGRLTLHGQHIDEAMARFTQEKDAILQGFHVSFPSDISIEWGNVIFHAVELVATVFIGPEAGAAGEAAKAAVEKIGKVKETYEAAFPVKSESDTHEDEVRKAKEWLAKYAKTMADRVIVQYGNARDMVWAGIEHDVEHFDFASLPSADFNDPAVQDKICEKLGITDPVANPVGEKIYLQMSEEFAGIVAKTQEEVQLGAPAIRERIEVIESYLAWIEKNPGAKLATNYELMKSVSNAGLLEAIGCSSTVDADWFTGKMKELLDGDNARLGFDESIAGAMSDSASHDVWAEEHGAGRV